MKYTNAMRLFRRLVLCLMIVWLPVQGFAAVAMPFCKHALGHSAAAQTAGDKHDHQKHHLHHGAPGENAHDAGSSGLLCDDCGACHLACSSSIVPATVVIVLPAAQYTYYLSPPTSLYLFYPEQPSRPPLTAIA